MNSTGLQDLATRLARSEEWLQDEASLIGASDREQAERLTKLATRIRMEIVLFDKKIEAARAAEKGGLS